MQRKEIALVGGILALLCLSTAAAETSQNDAVTVLETFATRDFQYQLAVAPCVGKKCPISVNLLHNGKRLDQKSLPQAAKSRKFARKRIHPAWTARLFNAAPELHVWESGFKNARVGVLARAVPLDAAHVGLLVTQLIGVDVLHRDHVLYVADEGKLKEIWSFSDSAPPVSSAVYPVTHQGKSYLLFWKDREGYPEGENVPDSHQASLLIWQADKKSVESLTLPSREIPLYAAVSGFHPDAVQARQATEKITCPANFEFRYSPASSTTADHRPYVIISLLATADYPQLAHKEKFFSGNVFFTRAEAQKYQEGLKHCTPATDSSIIPLH
jgi:hypothetical protein